jgi:DNA-binding XRE family transcriptional regulator
MISANIVEDIRQMLAEGRLSQRAIAVRTGISRGTVSAIAQGKRRDYPARYAPGDALFVPPAGRHVRCPGCGALAQMPCLACYLRRQNGRAGYR